MNTPFRFLFSFLDVNGPTAPVSVGGRTDSRKPRVLLAEDEPSLWVFLCELLSQDYEVEVATDSEHAWEAAQKHTPDLVLADALMPEVAGVNLIRRLRSDERTKSVPIILLSASKEKARLFDSLHAGADCFLFKPFKARDLLRLLREHLAGKFPDADQPSQA